MATSSTITVTRETREVLAREASERGISLLDMLAGIARDMDRVAVVRSEREAAQEDARSRDAAREMRMWEATLADGID